MGNVNVSGYALDFEAIVEMSQFSSQLNRMETQLISLTKTTKDQSDEVESYAKRAAVAIGSYMSLSTATNFINQLISVRSQFEQLDVSFRTMLGSKDKADQLMQQVTKFAQTTPFELDEVAGATKQLLAFGIGADKIQDTLRSLGDVAAGIGAPLKDVAYLYGTIKTAGIAQGEDIRQFAQRGIPIYEELAKVLSTNVENVKDFVSQGKVGFPEVERAFQNMTAQGSKFGGLMEAQSKTLGGQISNLQDAWKQMLNDIAKDNQGLFSGAVNAASDLVANYQRVLDVLKSLVIAYGSYRAAVIATTVAQQIQLRIQEEAAVQAALNKAASAADALQAGRLMVIKTSIQSIKTAWQGLMTTLSANPALVIAGAVGALSYAFMQLSKETDVVKLNLQGYNEELSKERDNLDELYQKALHSAEGTKERKEAIDQINSAYGSYLPNLLQETASNRDLAKAYDVLNDKIEQNIALKYQQKSIDEINKKFGDQSDEIYSDLIDKIKSTKGSGVAGAAAAEIKQQLPILKDLIAQRDRLISQGLATAGVDKQARDITSAFNKKYGINQGLFGNLYGPLYELALNQQQETKAKDQVKLFFNTYTNDVNKQVGEAKKTLEDYLKEKDFKSVFTKALDLAASKADLKKIQDRLIADKGSINPSDPNFQKLVNGYQVLIDEVQKKIDSYDPSKLAKQNAKAARDQAAEESKINALLNDRKDVLQAISDLQRDAKQSGLIKEQSEIDKINEKYDTAIRKVANYNTKVADFNKRNKTNVQNIGQADIDRINQARQTEVNNAMAKQDAENYKKQLAIQKDVFAEYEDSKNKVGIDKSNELYAEQTKGFTSYLEYLNAEAKKLAPKLALGIANIGDIEKLKAVTDAINDATKEEILRQQQVFAQAFQLTLSTVEKQKLIDQNYQAYRFELSKKFTGKELEERLNSLNKSYELEKEAAADAAIKQSEIFQRIGQDTTAFTKQQFKKNINFLEDVLKTGDIKDMAGNVVGQVTPEIEKLIKDTLEKLKKGLKIQSSSFDIQGYIDASEYTKKIAGSISEAADAVRPLNAHLADTFQELSNIASIGAQTMDSIVGFATAASTGDYVDAANSAVTAISSIVKMFAEAKKSAEDAKKAIEDFYTAVSLGAIKTAQDERQRALEKAKQNENTLKGLREEQALLMEQQKDSADEYMKLMDQIAKESYVAGESTKKGTGTSIFGAVGTLFGIGAKTETVQQLASLAGKSYSELLDLYNKGQLTDKAKTLFEQLQNLSKEGEDIQSELEALQDKINQTLTGTTAQSIADSIKDGLAQGKRSVADFADDFNSMMSNAVLSAFEANQIQPVIEEFYKEFAALSQSSGGSLTEDQINHLRDIYNNDVGSFIQQIQQLQQISGSGSSSTRTIVGGIQAMSEQTAEILGGQLGGLRLTAIEILNNSTKGLNYLQNIEANTALTVSRIDTLANKMYTWFKVEGVKIQ